MRMNQGKLLKKPAGYTVLGITGFLFFFCCLTGRDLAAEGNILWTGSYLLKTLGISLGAGAALGALVCALFYRLAGRAVGGRTQGREPRGAALPDSREPGEKDAEPGKGCGRWLWDRASGRAAGRKALGSMALLFLAWLPGFLAYYPAICAYDMPIQMGQALSGQYVDHHPIAHTLLLRGAVLLGENVFGSINAGIGCYALLQMAFLAAAFAYGTKVLYRRRTRRLWLVLVQLWGMLYPFHHYMSISVTKDTVFTAFFILQIMSLLEIVLGEETREGGGRFFTDMDSHRVLFFCSTVGMILFRNNGKYAFLVFLSVNLAAFLFGRKKRAVWGRLFLLSAGAFLTGTVLLSAVYGAVGAQQGDRREMLSLPIQQLARVMVYHGGVGVLPEDDGTMEEKDRALVNDFILNQAYRNYRPDFTDPVKSNVNTSVARYRTGEFLSSYLGLFGRYPGDYLNAALAVNAGYLYPGDVSHAYVNAQEGQAAGGGYAQTRWDEGTLEGWGIHKDSRWPGLHALMEEWADGNKYLELPVLKYLFVPGVWVWLYLLLLGWLLLGRRFSRCLPLALVLGYFLTLLLGPTVQLRYIYPMMAVFPFFLPGAAPLGSAGQES